MWPGVPWQKALAADAELAEHWHVVTCPCCDMSLRLSFGLCDVGDDVMLHASKFFSFVCSIKAMLFSVVFF